MNDSNHENDKQYSNLAAYWTDDGNIYPFCSSCGYEIIHGEPPRYCPCCNATMAIGVRHRGDEAYD